VNAARTTAALRTSAFIALGAFAVHQLRYVAGGGASAVGPEHSYLAEALPVLLVLAVSSALGATAVALTTGSATPRSPDWAFCATALLLIFGVQETAEGVAPFAHHGWIALPIAIAVGRVASMLLALFRSVEQRLTVSLPTRRAPAVVGQAQPCRARALARKPLAFGLARRPPPFAAV
jgi:hypothetical protein